MPYSMTGFASDEQLIDSYRLVWEIRSVNHRFLDIGFRLPEELRALEPRCRELANTVLRRGKVDCSLKVTVNGGHRGTATVNAGGLKELVELEAEVRERLPEARALSIAEVLRWPGVVEEASYEPGALEPSVMDGLNRALRSLRESRRREGERLAALLGQRCDGIDAMVVATGPHLPAAEERYREKLKERFQRLNLDANPERLEQELVLLAQRLDVTEELDRLSSHVTEIRDVLGRDEPVGRRLEFLIQELNREANTLSSKSQDEELTRAAVELKGLIEQMREQVQNLE